MSSILTDGSKDMQSYSRLQRRQDRSTKQRSVLFIGASIILLGVFLLYGLPALLGLTSTISNWQRPKFQDQAGPSIKPMTPVFSEPFEATRTAQIKITGQADPKVNVELSQNGQSEETQLTKDDGSFSFDVTLAAGSNAFKAQAISSNGTKSDLSAIYNISYLSSPPKLELKSPKDGDSVKDSPVMIQGSTDSMVSVTVNDRLAVTDSGGNFSLAVNLTGGDNKIRIKATDQAGNEKVVEITVKYSP